MHLISKIISKEWFKALLGAITVLFLLVSVGDIINGFLRNYPPKRIMLEYFLKLPELASKMFPISALLASLFSINKLKAHSELMAILASSYSVKKIYKLIFTCSLLIGAIQFVNLGYLVPFANKIKRHEFEKSQRNESKYLARSTIGKSGLIWYKTDNYFTSFKAFDSRNKILKDVTIYFLSQNKKLDSIYKAESAEFVEKNKWNLKNIQIIQSLDSSSFPKATTAANLFIELNEDPEDFGKFESDITTLNIVDLGSFIDRLNQTDINSTEYAIMFYEKISLAIICVIFALFPLAGVFVPNRRAAGFGKSVVITLLFSIFFWGIHSGAISLGNSGKIPIIAATLGIPAIFSLYIIVTFLRNRSL